MFLSAGVCAFEAVLQRVLGAHVSNLRGNELLPCIDINSNDV